MPRHLSPTNNAWDRVESGFTLMIAGLGIQYVSITFLFFFAVSGIPGTTELVIFACLVGGVLGIVGFLRLLATPDESGARTMIAVCVITFGASILAGVGGSLMESSAPTAGKLVRILGELSDLACFVLFLLYIRSLGRYLADQDLRESATGLLIWWTVGRVVFVVGSIWLLAPMLVLWLLIQFWYIRLLFQARDAVRTAPSPGAFARPRSPIEGREPLAIMGG